MPLSITSIKTCSKCLIPKATKYFSKAKTGVYGVRGDCKECQSISTIKYNLLNKTKQKEYRDAHKNNRRFYINNRIKTDASFKLGLNIRNLIRISLKRNGFGKNSKSNTILGCSFDEFKLHLESQFKSWMTWDNHGLYNGTEKYGWDIDHIIPVSTANSEIEILKLNHYTNLQPLCSYINRTVKRNKHADIL